jgi:hypothetical protein
MSTTGKIVGLILILLGAVFIASKHAQAKVPGMCAPSKGLDENMKKRFSETQIFRGIATDGYFVILYFDKNKKTWTVFGVDPRQSHMACPLSAGGDGQIVIDKGENL